MNIPDGQINYRLLGSISAGAHGRVLRAIHIDKNENDVDSLLAIKRVFVRPILRTHTNSLLCVLREIKCLQLLQSHSNVSNLIICNRFFVNLILLLIIDIITSSTNFLN